MSNAVKTRRIATLVLLLAVVTTIFWLHAEEDRRGPYTCNHCPLQNPMVDSITRAFIDSTRPMGAIGFPWEDDDVYVVCNATYCVDYRRTYPEDSYEGSNARPMQNGADGGTSSGGGETGESGGYSPGWDGGGGGGSTGGSTGTVRVGDPQTVQD